MTDANQPGPGGPHGGQPPHPPQQPGYPPPQQGYPPPQQGYPPQQPGYPPPQEGYPPQQPGYPPPQEGYPPQQPGYPPPQQGYPAQQAPQPGPNGGGPPPDEPASGGKWQVPLIGVLCVAAIGAALWFSGLLPFGGDEDAGGELGPGDILMEPAADLGPEPVSASLLASAPNPALAQPAGPATEIAVTAQVGIESLLGTDDGLYSGVRGQAGCDRAGVAAAYAADPAATQSAVSALNNDPDFVFPDNNLGPSNFGAWVNTLTPLLLTNDLRVTNHSTDPEGFGERQSVLQKGSAVLVDPFGLPRVRCASATVLIRPLPADRLPTYVGPAWPGFAPGQIPLIEQDEEATDAFVFTDLDTGEPVTRPVGTTGEADSDPIPDGRTVISYAEGVQWQVPADFVQTEHGNSSEDGVLFDAWTQPAGSRCFQGAADLCLRVRGESQSVTDYVAGIRADCDAQAGDTPVTSGSFSGQSLVYTCPATPDFDLGEQYALIVSDASRGVTLRIAAPTSMNNHAEAVLATLESFSFDVPPGPTAARTPTTGQFRIVPPPGYSQVEVGESVIEASTDLLRFRDVDINEPYFSISNWNPSIYGTPDAVIADVGTLDACDPPVQENANLAGLTGIVQRHANCGGAGPDAVFLRYVVARPDGGFLVVTGNDEAVIATTLESLEL